MDDDFQSLEAELKRLRPAAPSASLRTRVGESLTPPPRERRGVLLRWAWVAALPAAAAVAWVLWHPKAPARVSPGNAPIASVPSDAPAAEVLKPIAVENVLYAAHDEGLVTLADGTSARRQRLSFVDTVTWKNSRTNASLVWTVPREEIRLVPVVLQ